MYNRGVEAIEPASHEVVQWTNEWIELGKTEGNAEGRSQERRAVLLRLLRRRLGPIAGELTESILKLSDPNLDILVEDLLDFQTLHDGQSWLTRRA